MSGSEELKTYILGSREMSTSDNVIGSKMHWGILRSIQESATMIQPNSISPETLLLLLRKRTRSARSVPAGLQMELALLWRTLGILRYSVGIPGVLQSFYKDLLATIIDVDALSLSNFNERCESTDNQRNKQGSTLSVGFDNTDRSETSSAGKKRSAEVLFPVPELAYLTENSEFEGDDINDPLAIVQKLFNSSESFASAVPASERSAMHSVCLALAVKSGRLSLLLQSALMLVSEEKSDTLRPEQSISNLQILSDIVDYLMIGNDYKDLMLQVAGKNRPQSFPTSQYLSKLISNSTDASAQNPKKYINPAVCHTHENSSKRITLSFGKADHGKLGLGDSQVIYGYLFSEIYTNLNVDYDHKMLLDYCLAIDAMLSYIIYFIDSLFYGQFILLAVSL